jgi:hypothetical protein
MTTNFLFIKNLAFAKMVDANAKPHTKREILRSGIGCSCCPDWVIRTDGFIVETNLSKKDLKAKGILSSGSEDIHGYF